MILIDFIRRQRPAAQFHPSASGVRTLQQVQRHKSNCQVVSAVVRVCDVRLNRS